jgi:hypothetical protein
MRERYQPPLGEHMKAERMMDEEQARSSLEREEEFLADRKESERRLSPEVAEAKEYFIESLSAILPAERLKQLTPKEAFEAYRQDYLNEAAAFDNFKALLVKYGNEADRAKYLDISRPDLDKDKAALTKYREYLLRKLPREIQEREADVFEGEEAMIPLARLEKLAAASKLFLGYHVSDNLIDEPINISQIESQTGAGADAVTVPAGYGHYSVGHKSLYGFRRYLYLVEGSSGDLETGVGKRYNEASKARGKDWATSTRKLPILKRLKLTDELAKEFELGFV